MRIPGKVLFLGLISRYLLAVVPIVAGVYNSSGVEQFKVFTLPRGSVPISVANTWNLNTALGSGIYAGCYSASGLLYVFLGGNSEIISLDPSTGAQVAVRSAPNFNTAFPPYQLAIDSSGNFYASDNATQLSVLKYAPSGGTSSTFATFTTTDGAIAAMTFDYVGNLIVVVQATTYSQMFSVTPGGIVTTLNALMLNFTIGGLRALATGIQFDSQGNIYVSYYGGLGSAVTGAVAKFSPSGSVINNNLITVSGGGPAPPASMWVENMAYDPGQQNFYLGGPYGGTDNAYVISADSAGSLTNPLTNPSTFFLWDNLLAGPLPPPVASSAPLRLFTLGPTIIY